MKRRLPETPFVLLDDARAIGAAPARLYVDPLEIITTHDPAQVSPLLERLREGHWAGFLSYEAGHALEPRLEGQADAPAAPLLWFARFASYDEIAPEDVPALLPDAAGGWCGVPKRQISRETYVAALARVKDYISAGDIYQANLTFPALVKTAGHPLALYAGLRTRALAGYGGVVWTGTDWILSLSPELFFALHDDKLTTRPMKGTAARSPDPEADVAARAELRTHPKQRAENLMIVDLLRNDLSRVAEAGSVQVPDLFTVETYPTVHQMTSTVTARLQAGLAAADVIRAVYPCGSITGAPKIRAMEIIHEVESAPRGVYTGSIGRVDANGDAAFNVAIRTLHFPAGETTGRLGLGGGIVADSQMDEEWAECHAKGRFVADRRKFDLIETMRFEPTTGIVLLDRHLARLGDSAATFGFSFDRHATRNELQAATFLLTEAKRIRLLLAKSGAIAIEIGALPETPALAEVRITPLPVSRHDFRLHHKTTDRAFYDSARTAAGCFEVIFADEAGSLTEGSFTNIFVERGGTLLTPPATLGLLPGILRTALLASGKAQESDITAHDLKDGFLIGNALRGLIPAQLAP